MNVTVVGGGLSGVETAFYLAEKGVKVTLCEMRPETTTPAHKTEFLGELVCSNSLKAFRHASAGGLLKEEMRLLGSITLEAADNSSVPAGGALAVDREKFSAYITEKIKNHPNIILKTGEVTKIPKGPAVIASGPLTSEKLSREIQKTLGENSLSFYDAAAPIVRADSIDYQKVFSAARYGRGEADYINCPFEKEEYEAFWEALIAAEGAVLHEFEKKEFRVYEGCMPIEIMAKRGVDTLRFGPLKPVGLYNPKTNKRPYAVVQLRSEDRDKTNFNLVGFQTNLLFRSQEKVFRMIPGLENAVFTRYGVMHRNTFLNSPKVLDKYSRLKGREDLFFAGQMTGVEGYMESAMSGILAGLNLFRVLEGLSPVVFPTDTMIGALQAHISNDYTKDFEPMGANMGLLPPSETKIRGKEERYTYLADRAINSINKFLTDNKI